ncbi:DUF2478 domain-containing protein [Bradyrhizobium liaoningense]|uniref:DUF2478 domain-containing protein n=1 Tax=Bradyrhizobium liaoningense TaxID=43992 RepID=UPI001BA55C66|nr:DUF2478 domain-containing protein [Bradyrhizobium liaoningense]MBR0712870.1 DUF2478 domain-containing protein [Bradyrhizobium liaoningense]
MPATQSAPAPERPTSHAPVAAIVYHDGAFPDAAFEVLIERSRARGLALAGVRQRLVSTRPDRACDVLLEDLGSGRLTPIFEDRGNDAAGCRLDEGALAQATARVGENLRSGADLLVLNKFGKAECSGGGVLDLIADAMDRGIPVVIAVPRSNIVAWRCFAGEFAIELPDDPRAVEQWLADLPRTAGF